VVVLRRVLQAVIISVVQLKKKMNVVFAVVMVLLMVHVTVMEM